MSLNPHTFYRELTNLALSSEPPPEDIERHRQQFTSLVKQGHQPLLLKNLFAVDPRVSLAIHGYITRFLDSLRVGNAWVHSVGVLLALENSTPVLRPTLTPGQIAEIEEMFSLPCRVSPQLVLPGEVEVVEWATWIEHVSSLFASDVRRSIPMLESIPEEGTAPIIPFFALLHFKSREPLQESILDEVTARIDDLLTILRPTVCGLEITPMAEAMTAHRAFSAVEELQVRMTLADWDQVATTGKFSITEKLEGDDGHLILIPDGSDKAAGDLWLGNTFPWVNISRWRILQEWVDAHPNVQMREDPSVAQGIQKEMRREVATIPRIDYTMDTDNPATTPIGYTVMMDAGIMQDANGNVPITLTSDQAAMVAAAVKSITAQTYTVAPVPFLCLYLLASQKMPMVILKEAYVRIREECQRCCFSDFPIRLPAPPPGAQWIHVEAEQILAADRVEEFIQRYGPQMRSVKLQWTQR